MEIYGMLRPFIIIYKEFKFSFRTYINHFLICASKLHARPKSRKLCPNQSRIVPVGHDPFRPISENQPMWTSPWNTIIKRITAHRVATIFWITNSRYFQVFSRCYPYFFRCPFLAQNRIRLMSMFRRRKF